MSHEDRCRNMNHGRSNAPVRFCPNCGEKINQKLTAKCNSQIHATLRKDRYTYCSDCGIKFGK
ncbi:MAG: hypothetical protein ACXVA9_02170 [Bdellovibrionales bacterium]